MISSNYLFGAGGGEGGGPGGFLSGGSQGFLGEPGGGEMSLPTEYKGGIVEIDCQLTAGVIGISPSFMGELSKYHRDTTKNPGPLPPS